MVMQTSGAREDSLRTTAFRRAYRQVFKGGFARTSVLAFLAGSVGIACPAAKSNMVATASPSISHAKHR
jgi:hypothetical protein